MLSCGFLNFNGTFLLNCKTANMLGGTLFILCLLLNTFFLLVFAVYLGITSAAPIVLHFNLEKQHLPFTMSFGLRNTNRTFVLLLKSLKVLGGTLFVVCLPLNTLFLLFFAVQLLIASAVSILLHLTSKNIIRTWFLTL